MKKIRPNKDEVYEIEFDDKCLVIKQGENKVWVSKKMADWIAANFADKAQVEIKYV